MYKLALVLAIAAVAYASEGEKTAQPVVQVPTLVSGHYLYPSGQLVAAKPATVTTTTTHKVVQAPAVQTVQQVAVAQPSHVVAQPWAGAYVNPWGQQVVASPWVNQHWAHSGAYQAYQPLTSAYHAPLTAAYAQPTWGYYGYPLNSALTYPSYANYIQLLKKKK